MPEVTEFIVSLLRDAWGALALTLAAFVLLAMLAQVLRVASGSVLGANLWVWEAVGAVIGLLVLGLVAVLGVPAILRAAQASLPTLRDCGPINELGYLAIGIIGGLGAVRMLHAVISSVVASSVGGGSAMSSALMEIGEVILGMLIASIAYPLAVRFLGVC